MIQGDERCLGIAAVMTKRRVARANVHLVAAVSSYLRRAGNDTQAE